MNWLRQLAASSPPRVMDWPRGLTYGTLSFAAAALLLRPLPLAADVAIGVLAAILKGRVRMMEGRQPWSPSGSTVSVHRMRCPKCGAEATLMASAPEGHRLTCDRCRT